MASKRIYIVTEREGDEVVKQRLVNATNQSQAIRHVVAPRFTAEAGTPSQCVDLAVKGVKVEETAE